MALLNGEKGHKEWFWERGKRNLTLEEARRFDFVWYDLCGGSSGGSLLMDGFSSTCIIRFPKSFAHMFNYNGEEKYEKFVVHSFP